MFQAITVKYLPVTNTKPSRFKAIAAAGSVTLSYDYAMNASDNARAAAVALANKFGWPNADKLQGGQDHAGNYVFVFPWPNQG